MKVCPVCSARCFDDMEVCFGCMHRFTEEKTSFAVAPAKTERKEGGILLREEPPAIIGSSLKERRGTSACSMVVPAIAVCEETVDVQEEEPACVHEDESPCTDGGEALVLRIEIPRSCRGVSIAYR